MGVRERDFECDRREESCSQRKMTVFVVIDPHVSSQ